MAAAAKKRVRSTKVPGQRAPKKPAAKEQQKFGPKTAPLPKNVSLSALAALLGLTTRWVTKLVEAGTLPPPSGRSAYDLDACVKGYIASLKATAERAKDTSSADKLRDRREQEIALRMATKERGLIPLDDAVAAYDYATGEYLTSVSTLPARITRNPRERQRIESICDAERLRLSDRFAKRGKALRTGEPVAEAGDEDDA